MRQHLRRLAVLLLALTLLAAAGIAEAGPGAPARGARGSGAPLRYADRVLTSARRYLKSDAGKPLLSRGQAPGFLANLNAHSDTHLKMLSVAIPPWAHARLESAAETEDPALLRAAVIEALSSYPDNGGERRSAQMAAREVDRVFRQIEGGALDAAGMRRAASELRPLAGLPGVERSIAQILQIAKAAQRRRNGMAAAQRMAAQFRAMSRNDGFYPTPSFRISDVMGERPVTPGGEFVFRVPLLGLPTEIARVWRFERNDDPKAAIDDSSRLGSANPRQPGHAPRSGLSLKVPF